ncbi:HI0074 family nucleotidyltransferase substrate-binding subunit [Elusimicrobiota bacterium]
MSENQAKESFEDFANALKRLQEALNEPESNILAIDGTIQRFEFTFELLWKTFRRTLLIEGIETNTPKEALRKAYEARWIDDETLWLNVLKDRNETSHTYDETKARQIYSHIKDYMPELNKCRDLLKQRFKK